MDMYCIKYAVKERYVYTDMYKVCICIDEFYILNLKWICEDDLDLVHETLQILLFLSSLTIRAWWRTHFKEGLKRLIEFKVNDAHITQSYVWYNLLLNTLYTYNKCI